jgi:hypothetical protein
MLVSLVVLLVALVGVDVAHAAESDDPSKGPVAQLYAREFQTNRGLVIRVVLDARIPVSGTLTASDGDDVVAEAEVSLPTGGSGTVWLPVSGESYPGSISVVAELDGQASLRTEMAGVLTEDIGVAVSSSVVGARSLPSGASTVTGDSTAILAVVSADDLEQRTWVLNGFSVLATTTDELASLSAQTNQLIRSWVIAGGELLLDDDGALAWLDTQPESGRVAVLGSGAIRRTGGELRSGRWNGVISGVITPLSMQTLGFNGTDSEIVARVARGAVTLPPIGLLLLGVAVYGLLVGPLLHIVLRRKQKATRIWLIGPLISVLTTVAVLGLGLALRQQATSQFAAAVRFDGTSASSVTILRAQTKSDRVEIPPGWMLQTNSASAGVKFLAGRPLRADIEVASGGVGLFAATGPAPAIQAPISATATEQNGYVRIEITNVSDVQVRNISVSAGRTPAGAATSLPDVLGALDPGDTVALQQPSVFQDAERESLLQYSPELSSDQLVVSFDLQGAPAVSIKSLISGKPSLVVGALVVPVDGPIARSLRNQQGQQRIDISPSARFVSGEVFVGGGYVTLSNEPITSDNAPGGIVHGSGISVTEGSSTDFVDGDGE